MTVIVNKQKLYDRAIQHRAQDHIAQRTYGDISYSKNGVDKVTNWKGCAISCLATEATLEGIKNQPNFDFSDVKISTRDDITYWSINLQPETLRDILHRDFGLCDKLTYIAECVFEGSDSDYAVDWPAKFAEALPEGVDIDDYMVDEWWNSIGQTIPFDPYYFEDEDYGVWDIDAYFDIVNESDGEDLIVWLKSLAS